MLIKFRFKNYSCFESWEEIDFIDYNYYHSKTVPTTITNICGPISSGKTSIIFLIDVAIKYLKRFLIYDTNNSFNNISTVFNPSLFSKEHKEDEINNVDLVDLGNVYLELYFSTDSYIYKYELIFNNNFPNIESLSYKFNNNGHGLDDGQWINLYFKKNLTYEMIDSEETCVFKIDINELELELKSKPSLTHLNQKNSLLNYLKSLSKSKIIENFFDVFNKIIIFNEQSYENNLFKNFFIDKNYLINNKDRFLSAFNDMKINIVDYSIDNNNKIPNGFYLMIGKKFENKTLYLSSKFESNSTMRLFYLLYYIFKSIDDNLVLIIDDFDKYLGINEINYLISLINIQKNNKNNAQLLFTINDSYRNDLLGISQSNIDINKKELVSKIKRII